MRWNFIICLLLVSAVLTKPRPKRSLGSIKRLFSDKLFGTNKIVIAQPILTNNETYQLFEIPGHNDIIIKVSRNKTQSHKYEKPDAVIVEPEVAIIGSYLGTTTEKETILAIEMVKNLINSGVLTGSRGFVQELVVPLIPQPPQLPYYEDQNIPLNVYEGGSIYVPMGMQQVKTPVKTKYSYKQKTPDADTTYASYNGQDVIVTRTKKEPYIPQCIKLRIAEVATIGANTYAVRSSIPTATNVNPTPYYVNPGPMMPEYIQNPYFAHIVPQPINDGPTYVENNSNGGSIRQPIILNGNPIQYYANPNPMPQHIQNPASYFTHKSPQPLRNGVAELVANSGYGSPIIVDGNPTFVPQPIYTSSPDRVANNMQLRCKGIIGVCPYRNTQLKASNRGNIVSITDNPKQTTVKKVNDNEDANAYNIAVNEFLKNYSVNGQLMSQYLYKQMNHHSHENYTIVNVGGPPQLKDIGRNNNVRQDFVFIPPKDVNVPALPSVDKIGKGDKNEFVYKTPVEANHYPYVPSIKSNVQSNKGFEKPVVVFDTLNAENRGQAEMNEAVENKVLYDENNRRGDIPGAF